MKKIIFLLVCVSLIFTPFLFSDAIEDEQKKINDKLSGISVIMEKVQNAENSKIALKELKKGVELLDIYKTSVLRNHEKKESLGNIYLYYATMTKGNIEIDESIKLFTRSIEIKNDPYTHKELASLYKMKYDEAVIKKNVKEERFYGSKIYEHLDRYIVLSHNTSKVWQERKEYFNSYSKYLVAESNPKKIKSSN